LRILITGIAGFIGFHVAQRLRSLQHTVVGIDTFSPYYDVQLKKDRASLLRHENVTIYHQAVEDQKKLEALIQNEQISHIIHLAAQAGVRYSLHHPQSYIRANIDGFLSVLEVGRQYPHIPIIWASSSSVYGINRNIPFSEIDRTDRPSNLYGATKQANEAMAHAYHHLFGLSLIGLRFFTVYGPWGRPDMSYFLFTEKILNNQPIELYNEGSLKRDFTYIDDIVSGIIAALNRPPSFAIYNLGNHRPEYVNTLVSLLEKSLDTPAIIHHVPTPKTEIACTMAEISLAKKDLSFTPTISLQEGIPRFVEWYRSYYKK